MTDPDLMAWRSKSPRANPEEMLQRAIVQHLRIRGNPDAIWYHCPSGEVRSARTGAKLKAMGVQKGVPDLCFLRPDGSPAFMELKAVGGRMSPEQKAFQAKCTALGVDHAVVADIDTAIILLEDWGIIK